MIRYLGIDYGTKRIGLSVGDDDVRISSSLQTVEARGDVAAHARALLVIAEDYDVEAFVLGLPLNMDDTEGKQAKIVRRFGDELARVASKPVHYVDERLSSRAADELLSSTDMTRKKKKAVHDAVAAQVILQDFFDAQR